MQAVSFEEQLEALGQAVAAGKVRMVGLSNETPYGLMRFLHLGENSSPLPAALDHLLSPAGCCGAPVSSLPVTSQPVMVCAPEHLYRADPSCRAFRDHAVCCM